jgi:hypothetical protein
MTFYYTASLLQDSTYIFLVDSGSGSSNGNGSIIVPTHKPSLLSSLPRAVTLLTATGPKALSYTLNETGLVIPASQVLQPVAVTLGTYFFNYSAHVMGEGEGGAQVSAVHAWADVVSPYWPQVWWKAAEGKRTGVDSRMATGSRSLQRKRYSQVHGIPELRGSVHVDNAPCATRACDVYTQAGYVLTNTEGVCYRSSLLPGNEPAIQLQLWYNGALDNMGSPSSPNDGQAWQDVDGECWIYANAGSTPGARQPVEVWHNAALGDYWTLSSPSSRASAQSMGYTLVQQLGFMDPAPPSGRLSEQQLRDATADYAYVVRLDW